MKILNMKKYNKKNISTKLKMNFFDKFHIKIICFIFAIAAFFMVSYLERHEKVFICKLNISGLKDNNILSNDIPEKVKVIVRDKQKILDMLSENDFNIRLDLSKIDSSESEVTLLSNIPKPMNSLFSSIFSSVDIEPSKINVVMEELAEKMVPIDVNYTGIPEADYTITSITINPSEIMIQGPKKTLEKIKNIDTEKIDIDGYKESYHKEVSLINPNDRTKIIGMEKAELIINIEKIQN
jgi:YbbR domain-containing protein